jgi:hypothetical protein
MRTPMMTAMLRAIALSTAIFGFLGWANATTLGCTIFVAGRDGIVLAGNNEDNAAGFNPDTRIRFLPPQHGRFGIMFLGYADGSPQGGMNDQGLFFDGAALPNGAQLLLGDRSGRTAILEFAPDKRTALIKDEGAQLIDAMMSRSATVEGALVILTKRFEEKGIQFTVLHGSGDFQVATNFQQSVTPPAKITCERYKAAAKMLSEGRALSVELFRSILRATHQDGEFKTFYSNICDLKHGVIYLYKGGNFDKVVELHLDEELKKGERELKISECFK